MALLGFIIVLVVSTAVPIGVGTQPDAAPSEPIRVISNSHQIDFPEEVVLTVEAEATREIIEITLYYRLGNRKVKVYGYPQFDPATRVSADFVIKTRGTSYIPSGVDIEYSYVIRDAEGNTFESEVFFVEYKDPAFDWQRYRQGDLIVLWHNRPRETVVEVATAVSERLDSVKRLMGLQSIRPMKAVILNNGREAGRSFPFVSQTATDDHLYGGFAFGDLDVFVLVGLNADGMVHEMTHLLFDEAVYSPLARVPAWLNEGLATYFGSRSDGGEAVVARAAQADRLLPLRHMAAVPGRPSDVRLFYAEARSVVSHMIETHGEERMAALLTALNDGIGLRAAIHETYGMSLEGLEREWRARLDGPAFAGGGPNPAALGTPAIISGAVAVTVVAFVIKWLRHVISPP